MSHQRTIDVQDGDDTVVKEFVEEVRKLAGLIIEGVGDHPEYLLSPILRELMVEQARKVEHYRVQIGITLMSDNPVGPLRDRLKP